MSHTPAATTLKISPSGVVLDTPGVVKSPGTIVVARRNGVIVLKSPGRHYHRGTGQPWGYGEATYEVYREEVSVSGHPSVPGPEYVSVRGLVSFPVRNNAPVVEP